MSRVGAGDPARRDARHVRRMIWAAALTLMVVVVQIVAGLAAGSLGLVADAGHNLADTAAVVLALIAVRLSRRGPSGRRTFGGLRFPVVAAQANAVILLAVTVWLVIEAARRLIDPQPVTGSVVAIVALVATVVNAAAARLVHEPHGDLNTRVAVLHLASDAVVSLAVAVAGAIIWSTGGGYRLDPAISLVVALLVGVQGVRLLRQSSAVLLEATPRDIDLAAVQSQLTALPGVVGVHDIHVWSLSDRMHAASVHVCLEGDPSLTSARQQGAAVKELLHREFGIDHSTVELETVGPTAWCEDEPGACAAVERHLDGDQVRRSTAQSPS